MHELFRPYFKPFALFALFSLATVLAYYSIFIVWDSFCLALGSNDPSPVLGMRDTLSERAYALRQTAYGSVIAYSPMAAFLAALALLVSYILFIAHKISTLI